MITYGVAERGCYFLLFSAIFCYSGHLDFLARLKEVLFCTTFCYFLLLSAIFCYFGVVSHTNIDL